MLLVKAKCFRKGCSPSHLVGNDDGLRFRLMALEVNRPMLCPYLFAAKKLGKEVQMPHGAAELAVGYCVKAGGFC